MGRQKTKLNGSKHFLNLISS